MINNIVLVEPGDTLSSIALAVMGDAKFADAIAAVNGIPDPNMVLPGMILRLPQADGSAKPSKAPVQVAIGKIDHVEFGPDPDHNFDLSLRVELAFDGMGVSDRSFDLDTIKLALIQAGVRDVSQLRGKPVQVTRQGNSLIGWRILTEVL